MPLPHPSNGLAASEKLLSLAGTSLSLLAPACHSRYIPADQQWSSGTAQPPQAPSTGFLTLAAHFHSVFHCEGLDLRAHLLPPSCHREKGLEPAHSLPGDSTCPLLGLTTALGLLKLSWKSLWVENDKAKMVIGSKILLLTQSWPPNRHINFGNCLTLKIPG